jgi:uncharacterized protein
MSSNEPATILSREQQRMLLDVASRSIDYRLSHGKALEPVPVDYPEPLRVPGATFVTLRIEARLRGCMGSLHATEPLVIDVARNAATAAFHDPRFPPLVRDEFGKLDIHLSLLSPPEAIEFESEAHLLSLIRPGIDGLTLTEGARRGTFLPAVWETLTEPREFLAHLKRKAGLQPDYWSDTLRVERYAAESVGIERA